MSENHIVIHAGMGKTGTSSLQTFLSLNADQTLGNTGYRYCAIMRDGNVLSGRDLKTSALSSRIGYVSSFHDIPGPQELSRAADQLNELFRCGVTPIVSQENWSTIILQLSEANFLRSLGCRAKVIAYVRPQVEWFNSGWWQWWAWMGKFDSPEELIDEWGFKLFHYSEQLQHWKSMEGVDRLDIRLHTKDVIGDFLAHLGVYHAPGEETVVERKNIGLNSLIIRLYRTIPGMRHPLGAELDKMLSELLPQEGKGPWALSPDLISRIQDGAREDNIRLMSLMSEDQRDRMRSDERWWAISAYADKSVDESIDTPLEIHEYQEIIQKLTKAYYFKYF